MHLATGARDPGGADAEPERIERIAALGARALRVERLVPRLLDRGPLLPDARTTFVLHDAQGAPRGVAQLAGETAPAMVARLIDRARGFCAALDAAATAPVLRPAAEGEIDGRSWAVWPWCKPLARTTGTRLERRRLRDPLHAWLGEVTRQSAHPVPHDAIEPRFVAPLTRMATRPALSVPVRLAARSALVALDRGAFRPMHVAMHGDLHTGNVLIDTTGAAGRDSGPWAQRFVVIDWGGADADGFPIFDLARLAHSLRTGARHLGASLRAHSRALDCPIEHAPWHLAAAFADLGDHLEYFPVEHYARLADLCFSLLAAAGAPIPA